jgi:succinylglutamate desuccinylase
MSKISAGVYKTVQTHFKTSLTATAALVLLAVPQACAPGPRYCSPQADRFDGNGGLPSRNDQEVHPATGVAAVALAAAGALAGQRCD